MVGDTSFGARVQAYCGLLSHTPAFAASATDLATLALIALPLSHSKAESLWARAGRARLVRPFERRVLEGMGVEEAAEMLKGVKEGKEWKRMSPLGVLSVLCVRAEVRRIAGRMFVRAMNPSCGVEGEDEDEVGRVVRDGRAIGGRTAGLVGLLEKVAGEGFVSCDSHDGQLTEGEGGEETILRALALVRRLFPSALGVQGSGGVRVMLSPPPSPSPRSAKMRGALRRMLGEEVFEGAEGDALEEARDRVVDILVEADRAGRGRA